MLSYNESLKEYGREEGIEIGMEKGKAEGIQIGKTEGIGIGIRRQMSKYMENGHSFDEAFDLFAEPGMDRDEVRRELIS